MFYDAEHVPTVRRFWECDKFIRYLQGPFGSGKSSGCVQEIVRRAARQAPRNNVRRTRWAVVRNTYRQLADTTIKTWLDWYPPPGWGHYKSADGEYHMRWRLTDGTIVECEVLFRALDRPDQVGNLLSLELTGAWFNEMREIPLEIFEAMHGRVGRFPARKDGGPTWWGVIGDSNPPDDDSWIYDLFERKRPDNAEAFYQPSGLSPEAENLPNLIPNYYQQLAQGKSHDYIKVYINGQYGSIQDGKPVYPEYNDQLHCDTFDLPQDIAIDLGWDFGLTPAVALAYLHPNGRWFIFDEVTAESAGINQFIDVVDAHLAANYPKAAIRIEAGDPAGNQRAQTDETTVFDVLHRRGHRVVPGEQALNARLEAVRGRLTAMVEGLPALVVHPRASRIRKGFNGQYHYRRVRVSGEHYTPQPEKNAYSHPHDALQYIATNLFEVVPQRAAGFRPRQPKVLGTVARGSFFR